MSKIDDTDPYLAPLPTAPPTASPSLRKIVRGAEKLKGVQPDLLNHWNDLQGEFSKAGLSPEIKSGFRTVQQQQALYNNPVTRARTKGNDGINKISPHQEGRALDISFPSTQRAKGHQIMAEYARRSGLSIPSDEPWHISLPRGAQEPSDPFLAPLPKQSTAQAAQPETDDPYLAPLPQTPAKTEPTDFQGQGVSVTGLAPSEHPLTPKTSVSLGEGAVDASSPPKPLDFDVENLQDQGVGKIGRSAAGTAQTVKYGDLKTPDNHPLLIGKRHTLTFDKAEDVNPDSVADKFLAQYGPEYQELNRKFKEETGSNLINLNSATNPTKEGDKYTVNVRPTRGSIDAINAYATGGMEGLREELAKQHQTIQSVNDQTVKAMKDRQGVGQDLKSSIANEMIKTGQYAQNVKDLATGTDPALDSTAQQVRVSEGNLPQPTTRTGALASIPIGAAGAIARAESIPLPYVGFPLQQYIENADRGPEQAFKSAMLAAPLMAAGPIARSVGADALSPLQRQLYMRGLQAYGQGGTAAAQGAGAREIATAAATGAAFPTGKRGEVAEPSRLSIEEAPISGVQGRGALDADATLAVREAAVKPVTDAQGNVLLNADEIAADPNAKPKIRLASKPDEIAHPANFQVRDDAGKFDGPVVYPEEFTQPPVPESKPIEQGEPNAASDSQVIPAEQSIETKAPGVSEGAPVQSDPYLAPLPDQGITDETNQGGPERKVVGTQVAPVETSPGNISDTQLGATRLIDQTAEGNDVGSRGRDAASEPSTTSARKDQLAQDRAELDLPELPQTDRKSWRASLTNAKEKGLDQKAERLADQVLKNPHALDDEQTAGMVLRLQQLKNEHSGLLKDIEGETDPAKLAEHRTELDSVEQTFDKLTEAVKKSGTEKGRSLASQKLTINQDYDLVSMLNRYKAKVGKGPNPEIRAQIEKQNARITDLEKQLADRQISPAVEKLKRETRKVNRQASRKVLDDEAATIKQNIAAEFARLKTQRSNSQFLSQGGLGSLDPEGVITKQALKYVRNRVEAGITDAAQLVDDVHGVLSEFIDGVTKRQVAEMISGYGKPVERQSDLQRQIDALKTEMYKALSDADIEAGKRSPRSQGPHKSDIRKLPLQGPTLREGVGPKEGPSLGPKQGPHKSDILRLPKYGPRLSEGIGPKEGPQLGPKQGPPETKRAIERRYQKQISELERRMKEQDFAPKAKRGPMVLDSDTQKIQVNLERAKQDYQRQLRAWQESQRSRFDKTRDVITKVRRAIVLSSTQTLAKLTSAAMQRMITSPVESVLGAGIRRLPGAKGIAEQAPVEGPNTLKAEIAAAKKAMDTIRDIRNPEGDIRQALKTGRTSIDVMQGKRELDSTGWLGLSQRIHGALKTVPKLAGYERGRTNALESARQQGLDINDPVTMATADTAGYLAGNREILMQDNAASKFVNESLGSLERKGIPGKIAATAANIAMPIKRVPMNYVTEALNYAVPGGRAALGIARAAFNGELKNLKPDEADAIFRSLKKAGPGAAMLLLGYFRPQTFGGYYQQGEKRKDDEAQAGGMRIGGYNIPRFLAHSPLMEAAQIGATLRRVHESLADAGKSSGAVKDLYPGVKAAGKGLGEEVPFIEEPYRALRAVHGEGGGVERYLGTTAKSALIPPDVQRAAAIGDQSELTTKGTKALQFLGLKKTKPVPRSPSTIGEEIKMGFPGLRQSVPANEKKIKADFKSRLLDQSRSGKSPDLDSLVDSGRITKSDQKAIEREADLTPFQATFGRAFPDKALDRYERMNPTQRMQVEDLMARKAFNLINSDSLTEKQKADFQKRINDLGIEPTDPRKRNSGFSIPSFRSRFMRQRGAHP